MGYYAEEDQALTKALTAFQEKRLAELPTDDELNKITLSEKLERKMQKLIAAQKRPYYTMFNTVGKRVASIAVIVVLLAAVTLSAFPVVTDASLQFVVKVHEKGTDFSFPQPATSTDVLVCTYPTYVPDGYERVDYPESPIGKSSHLYCHYENEEGNKIWFYQILIHSSLHFGVNTEGVEIEDTYINGFKGVSYCKDNLNNIVWRGGDYLYYLAGDIPKDELLKMAESIDPFSE